MFRSLDDSKKEGISPLLHGYFLKNKSMKHFSCEKAKYFLYFCEKISAFIKWKTG